MKRYSPAVVIVCIGLLLSGCVANVDGVHDRDFLPDLVVPILETKGTPTINLEEGRIEVPIRAVVENQGREAADFFQVAAYYTAADGRHTTPFMVAGYVGWYPHTNAPLAAGDNVTFVGVVGFSFERGGSTVSIEVLADSCEGAEFVDPDYCRVEEADEDNNLSDAILVSLPVYPP